MKQLLFLFSLAVLTVNHSLWAMSQWPLCKDTTLSTRPTLMRIDGVYNPSSGAGAILGLEANKVAELDWMPVDRASMHSAYFPNYLEYGLGVAWNLILLQNQQLRCEASYRLGVYSDIDLDYRLLTLGMDARVRTNSQLTWIGQLGAPLAQSLSSRAYSLTVYDSEPYYLVGVTWCPLENLPSLGLHANGSNGLVSMGGVWDPGNPWTPITVLYNLQRQQWLVGVLRPLEK